MSNTFFIQNCSAVNETLGKEEVSSLKFKCPTVVEQNIIVYISASICVIGTVSNLLSLTFFFLNWSNKLGEKLLVLLNLLDLMVCLTGTILFALNTAESPYPVVFKMFSAAYFTFLESTAFVTTLLTVVRALATYLPFYDPSIRLIRKLILSFLIYASGKAIACVLYPCVIVNWYNILLLFSLWMSNFVVFAVNFLTIRKLLTSGKELPADIQISTQQSKHASITILILSTLFCFLNLLYSVVLFNFILGKETISVMFRNTVIASAVPMNSAFNPFVYFCRKRELREFLLRIMRCFNCLHS